MQNKCASNYCCSSMNHRDLKVLKFPDELNSARYQARLALQPEVSKGAELPMLCRVELFLRQESFSGKAACVLSLALKTKQNKNKRKKKYILEEPCRPSEKQFGFDVSHADTKSKHQQTRLTSHMGVEGFSFSVLKMLDSNLCSNRHFFRWQEESSHHFNFS